MERAEARKILIEYVKACREDDMLTLEKFEYEEIMEAMSMGVEALSTSESSKDLEEAAKEYATEWHKNPDGSAWKPYFEGSAIKAFKAGAEWQKEQMLKEAVEKTVGQIEKTMAGHTSFIHGFEVTELDFPFINSQECGYGDKVKIVIVKED